MGGSETLCWIASLFVLGACGECSGWNKSSNASAFSVCMGMVWASWGCASYDILWASDWSR